MILADEVYERPVYDAPSCPREPYVLYTQRRAQVMTALSALPGVSLPEPQDTFYAFPQFEGLTDSTAFTARLVRETGVALAPGVGFGAAGEGYLRWCFASTEQTVARTHSRLRAFLDGQPSSGHV